MATDEIDALQAGMAALLEEYSDDDDSVDSVVQADRTVETIEPRDAVENDFDDDDLVNRWLSSSHLEELFAPAEVEGEEDDDNRTKEHEGFPPPLKN